MDDKRDNIFEENENNIKNEEHIEETSKNTEDEMKETSDRESMKETQKLFNNENIDESEIFYMKETPSFEDIERNFEKYEHIVKKIVPYTGNDERKKFTGE